MSSFAQQGYNTKPKNYHYSGDREQGTGNRLQVTGYRLRRERQPNGFGQLYFSLLMYLCRFFSIHILICF
ncbi:MAG: hypothetical protein ACK46N_04210 [Dolichospermum sp.]